MGRLCGVCGEVVGRFRTGPVWGGCGEVVRMLWGGCGVVVGTSWDFLGPLRVTRREIFQQSSENQQQPYNHRLGTSKQMHRKLATTTEKRPITTPKTQHRHEIPLKRPTTARPHHRNVRDIPDNLPTMSPQINPIPPRRHKIGFYLVFGFYLRNAAFYVKAVQCVIIALT